MRRTILIQEKKHVRPIANFHFPGVNELLMSTLALRQRLGNKMVVWLPDNMMIYGSIVWVHSLEVDQQTKTLALEKLVAGKNPSFISHMPY